MREDIRKLQTLVYNFMKTNKITQEKMAELGAPELSRGKLGYLINGNATTLDVMTLAGYAKAMRIPFSTLAAQIDVLGATPATSREGALLAEFQSVAELVPTSQKEALLQEFAEALERAKTTIHAG